MYRCHRDGQYLKINGPLFFAAADRVFGDIAASMKTLDGAILYMDGVTLLDAGGVAAMNKLVDFCARGEQTTDYCGFAVSTFKNTLPSER